MKIRFTVPGQPMGKGRPQFSTYGGHVHARTPQKTVLYENRVTWEYQLQCSETRFPDDAMLRVTITAYYSIPKSKSIKAQNAMRDGIIRPVKKPDVDNICKTILDSLNNVAYHDDAQVVECKVEKHYSEAPRVEVTIEDISGKSREI